MQTENWSRSVDFIVFMNRGTRKMRKHALAGAEATAKLIDKIPGTVFVSGDLAYPNGSDEDFANCYGPTWGRFKDRTRPAPGNHEYNTDGASGYVRYFGAAAGDPTKGYYSYELGG